MGIGGEVMAKTIEDVITALYEMELTLTGVETAYNETPESLASFPCFINYPMQGAIEARPNGATRDLHTIVCEMHCSRGILPEAEKVARPFIERFRKGLLALESAPTGKPCDTYFAQPLQWTYGVIEFATEKHMGIRFLVTAKIMN